MANSCRRWIDRLRGVGAVFVFAAALTVGLSRPATAHTAQFTTLKIKIEPDGRFEADLNIDLLAFSIDRTSADASNEELEALLDGPRETLARNLAGAGDRFTRETVLRTDAGRATVSAWQLPGLADVEATLARKIEPRIVMPGEISFSGTLPPGARRLSVRLPYVLGETMRIYELPGGRSFAEPVSAGAYSTEVGIDLSSAPISKWTAFARYVAIGFEHIVPEGLDHILFVLGLFLLSARLAPLLWQVSAFTVAHSITLGLSMYGVFRLPPSIVEPIISASIALIAIENLFTSELKPWRPFVIFAFGLIHGLGFAGALAQVGLPKQDYFLGLIGFNIGVEFGQLAVILGAFLTVGWFRNRPWYRRVVVVPGSAIIALVAIYWTLQRIGWLA